MQDRRTRGSTTMSERKFVEMVDCVACDGGGWDHELEGHCLECKDGKVLKPVQLEDLTAEAIKAERERIAEIASTLKHHALGVVVARSDDADTKARAVGQADVLNELLE